MFESGLYSFSIPRSEGLLEYFRLTMQEKKIFTSAGTGVSRFVTAIPEFLAQPSLPFAVIFSCLAAGLVLKIVFINGPHGSDDLNYYRFAEQILTTFNLDTYHHHAGRLAFLVLSGFPAVIMGNIYYGALANVFYSLLTEILVIRFVYVRLGPSAAAIGAVFLVFSGVSLVYSGILSPEPVLTLFFTFACLGIYRAISSNGPERWTAAALAGIAAGLAFSAKEPGILLLPPAVLALLLLPWPLDNLKNRIFAAAIFIAGFGAVWLLESTAYWFISGDFLYKSQAVAVAHNKGAGEGISVLMFVKRGYWSLDEVWSEFRDFLFLPTVLAGVVWAYMLKFRGTAWPSIALAGLFTAVYLFFGTSSLSRLVNLPFQERYSYVLFPMIAIGVAFLFYKSKSKIVRMFLIGVIFIHSISSIHGATHRSGDLYFESLLRNAAIAIDLVQQKERKIIYVDRRYRNGLRHYLPSETFRSLRDIPEKIPLPPGYYMVFYNHLAESYKRPTPMRSRYEEIARLPVALRVALPHSFASRYFSAAAVPQYGAIVHEKRR